MKHWAMSSEHLVLNVMRSDYEMISPQLVAATHLVCSKHTAFDLFTPAQVQLSSTRAEARDMRLRNTSSVNHSDSSSKP